jgi:hypothetical protein
VCSSDLGQGASAPLAAGAWSPPMPRLSRLPTREDLLPLVEEALRVKWGLAPSAPLPPSSAYV